MKWKPEKFKLRYLIPETERHWNVAKSVSFQYFVWFFSEMCHLSDPNHLKTLKTLHEGFTHFAVLKKNVFYVINNSPESPGGRKNVKILVYLMSINSLKFGIFENKIMTFSPLEHCWGHQSPITKLNNFWLTPWKVFSNLDHELFFYFKCFFFLENAMQTKLSKIKKKHWVLILAWQLIWKLKKCPNYKILIK